MQILRRCHVSVPHPGVHLWLHFSISSARRTKSVQKWINDTCTNPHFFFFWMFISLNSLTLTEKTVQYHSEVGNGFKKCKYCWLSHFKAASHHKQTNNHVAWRIMKDMMQLLLPLPEGGLGKRRHCLNFFWSGVSYVLKNLTHLQKTKEHYLDQL